MLQSGLTPELFAAMRRLHRRRSPQALRRASRPGRRASTRSPPSTRGSCPACATSATSSRPGEMFLPDMMLAARAMQKARGRPRARDDPPRRRSATVLGRVVIGTVKGDIHEIGKNLVGDDALGERLRGPRPGRRRGLRALRREGARGGRGHRRRVGAADHDDDRPADRRRVLAAAGLRPKVKVIVGGAPVTRGWAEQIGADGYSEDAVGAVALARSLVGA